MNAPSCFHATGPHRARHGLFFPARAPLAAVLALATLPAFAGGAIASTADGVSYGHRVDLTLTDAAGDTTRIVAGPEPRVDVAAPPANSAQGAAGGSRIDGPKGLGTVLATGRTAVDATVSADADADHAAAAVSLDDVQLSLGGLLTLTAGRIAAEAEVVPEDGESCWSGTLGGSLATFQRATLAGSLVPVPVALPPGAPPDFVLFDQPGVATVTLNEQVAEGGRVAAYAVHVELHELRVLGVGTLRGHVYLGHAGAVLGCGGADVAVVVDDPGETPVTGDALAFRATVSNSGPERAMDVLVELPLPPAVEPRSAIASRGGCAIAGGTVTCALGDLRVGEEATVEVTARAGHCGAIAVPVDTAAVNLDPLPGDNHACGMALVPGPAEKGADLGVEVIPSAETVSVGQLLTYTVRVRHEGGQPVSAALSSLDLPWATWLVAAVPDKGSCAGGRLVACDLGPMAAGEEVTVTVTAHVWASGWLQAIGFVSSELPDSALKHNYQVVLTEAEQPGA